MAVSSINIRIKNNGQTIRVPNGSTLQEVYASSGLKMEYGPVSARINNKVQGLNYRFYNSKDVEFLTLRDDSGMRAYQRTLFLVLAKSVEDLFPKSQLIIGAPVNNGYFCELRIGRPLVDDDVHALLFRMKEIVQADMPINRIQCPIEEAIETFRSRGMMSKVQLLETQGSLYAYYYKLGNTIDYFYSSLLTHTGQIHLFHLQRLNDGILLRTPSQDNPAVLKEMVSQPKLLGAIKEHLRWLDILGVRTVGELNSLIKTGNATGLINVSEALQERKLTQIADEIKERGAKLVLIAGPSSSGKTTTSKRLAIQLICCGMKPHTISTDNYFVNRVDTPRDANGEYDFECIEAVDTALFNDHMSRLLRGERVELPRYDFSVGERKYEGNYLQITSNDVIILEGNHALNPIMSEMIADEDKYRLYVSTVTTIALDDHNYVPTSDVRLLRRIVRDFRYRGFSAAETIHRNPSVMRGEKKWIYPFEENADATFNSALLYELNVIRNQVMPILQQVSERTPEYSEACRLRKFLSYLEPVPDDQVPPTSLLREFAGGSSFKY